MKHQLRVCVPEKKNASQFFCLSLSLLQHPFIKSSKPNSILRALITDAMEIKLKRQEEEEQREQDAEDDDNSVQTGTLRMIKMGRRMLN